MEFLALIPIFQKLIERIFPDKAKADEANIELQKVLTQAAAQKEQADAAKIESQSKVIVAEAQSQSYAARNWRPHLMYCLMLTYPVNWILFPILRACGLDIPTLPIPTEYWTVLSIGLGGYIGVEGIKTYSNAKFNNDKYFNVLRQKIFTKGITQDQVDALNEAVKEAQE